MKNEIISKLFPTESKKKIMATFWAFNATQQQKIIIKIKQKKRRERKAVQIEWIIGKTSFDSRHSAGTAQQTIQGCTESIQSKWYDKIF